IIRDRLGKSLGGGCGCAIKFSELGGRAACNTQRFPFSDDLAYQSNLLGLRRVKTSSRKNQVANNGVAQITLESRNAAEAWNETEPQFRKAEAGSLVSHDQIANQGQFKASSENDAMHSSDCR